MISYKLRSVIGKTLDITLSIILGVMSGLVAVNVFFRFVLNESIYWGDEVALVLMVWLTFLGAAVATRENEHYEFVYLVRKLRGVPLKLYVCIRNTINIVVILMLGFYSTKVAIEIHSWILPATQISRAFVYAACPVGCVFMLYYSIERFMADVKQLSARAKEKTQPEQDNLSGREFSKV